MKTMHHPSAAARAAADVAGDEHRLVQEQRPVVTRMARALARRSGAGVEVEDLVAAGLIGVLRAARSYDAAHCVPFLLFAARHARWAMLTELRNTRPMRRSASERRRQLRGAEERLVHRLHGAPTTDELAGELAATPATVARWQAEVASAEAAVARIGRGSDDADTTLDDVADHGPLPDDIVLELELAAELHRAIALLPPRLESVVRTTFFDGRRLVDVAEELGITESRVSQLRSEAVQRLRTTLAASA